MSRPLLGFSLCLCVSVANLGFSSSPELRGLGPRGGQAGTEIDVTLYGERLTDVQEIFFYKPGLSAAKLEPGEGKTAKVRLRIAADAPLGEHPLRVRTSGGITELRTFHVGPFRVVDEKEPNNDFKAPQRIDLNVTVHGVVQNEDVDHFLVAAKKGQRLTAELEGMRLGVGMFDAYVAILDARRFELDASDDTALLLQDPMVSVVVPEDGEYVVQVREASYGGGDSGQYRLHVGTFARPTAVYPPGGRAGTAVELTLLGDVQGPISWKGTLPATPDGTFALFASDAGGPAPSPNLVRVSDVDNVLEQEPNDASAQATAAPLELPAALNGIIQAKGDQDCFRVRAKKGQVFHVRCHARSVRSPLDPVLTILGPDGKAVAANDDQGGPDSQIRWNVGADGEYVVHVRDHLRAGGPTYVYRVEILPVRPSLHTHIPAYDREPRDQTRQWVVVPRGNRFATWIRVNRTDASGETKLSFHGLPAGVTATCDPIAPGVDRVPVVFEAAADAPIAGALADVVASSGDVKGGFHQQVNLIYGQPNNTVYYATSVQRLATAVAEPAPFSIRLAEPKVPLVQGGAMNLRVLAERREGFTKPIALRMLWTPPGVGAANEVTIPEGQSEADYPVNADGKAAVQSWRIAVLGSADAGAGPVWVSTPLAPLRIDTPYVGARIDLTAVPQGGSGTVTCKLEVLKPFEGKAKVFLRGLPPGVTANPAEREVTKDDKAVEFAVAVEPKSPAGVHKSIFCQILVPEAGDHMAHAVAGGSAIRIDPPPKNAPAAAAKPGEKPAATKKLSRLEQLRAEAEKKEQKR